MNMMPYKVKTFEQIKLIPKEERLMCLQNTGYNPFPLPKEAVSIDLLTDSGTGALSKNQRSAMGQASRAYCGSPSFRRLVRSVNDIFGFEYVVPVQQGRGAEHVTDFVLVQKGSLVPGNAHFDTTKANIEIMGGHPVNCTVDEAYDMSSDHQFKGNIDLSKLEKGLQKYAYKVSYVLHTVTCNQVGGQPVSMENISEVSGMMSLADGMLMSGKKNCLSPGGGFIALRNKSLYEKPLPYSIAFIGGMEYGGMTGETMEAFAVGIREGIEEDLLAHRVSQVRYLGNALKKIGVPFITPVGGHAIFVDAGKWLSHIQWDKFPGHALVCKLYEEDGIRCVEVGSLIEGRDPKTKENRRAKMELVRLAVPHRPYAESHFDFIAEAFNKISGKRQDIKGVEFTHETYPLRHFTSKFRPI